MKNKELASSRSGAGYSLGSRHFQQKHHLWVKLLLLILLSSVVAILIPYHEAVGFQYENTGKLMCYLPIDSSEPFSIKYTHSIHGTDVIETYRVTEEQQIKQIELQFEEFAIGMPENAGEGEVFEQMDGVYYIKNMNRVFPSFDLRTGKVRANHRLVYQTNEYALNNYIPPGTWVRVKVLHLSLIQQWRGVNMSD